MYVRHDVFFSHRQSSLKILLFAFSAGKLTQKIILSFRLKVIKDDSIIFTKYRSGYFVNFVRFVQEFVNLH